MSKRSALFVGVAALAALAACSPAAKPTAAPTTPAAPSTPATTQAAPATTKATDGGQGGGGSNVPSWSGVDFATESRAHDKCLPSVKKDEVFSVKYADLTGDGRTEAVVTAACHSSTSQNSVRVFVYDGQDRKQPLKLLATIGADRDLTDVKVGTHQRQVTIDAEARSDHTPLCCPDLRITETWTYSDGHLHRTASQQKAL